MGWVITNVIEQNIFTVENWMEVSFHMCKQRWDSSMDWLEMQPMSKIHTMLEVIKQHNAEQEKAQKQAARKRK